MSITTNREADCYVVRFPDHIELELMKKWGHEFKSKLVGESGLVLLLDTNTHNFESVECLKWLREFLTKEDLVVNAIKRVAFVQSEAHRVSGIISDREGYFSNPESAKKWLDSWLTDDAHDDEQHHKKSADKQPEFVPSSVP